MKLSFEMYRFVYDPFSSFGAFNDPIFEDPLVMVPSWTQLDFPQRPLRLPQRVKVSRSEVVSDKEKFEVKIADGKVAICHFLMIDDLGRFR